LFHRFVRPTAMSEQRINQYIEGKYWKFVNRVWHDTALPFKEVLLQFEAWLTQHQLWTKESGGPLNRAAFITCGDWDLKTKVPEQCKVSMIKLPPYFMEWINIKDAYSNFYWTEVSGMRTMLNHSNIPLQGSHHLGIDDTKNIARVLQRMLSDGAFMQITA
ncbi:LOW QUALITY PROTEIN: RNase_T domain-containing protein, partial [Cephalotus follicularis]